MPDLADAPTLIRSPRLAVATARHRRARAAAKSWKRTGRECAERSAAELEEDDALAALRLVIAEEGLPRPAP